MAGYASLQQGDQANGHSNMSLSGKPTRRANGGSEPLLRFREAKKVLGDIYSDLGSHVDDLDIVYNNIGPMDEVVVGPEEGDYSPDNGKSEIGELRESIRTIVDTFRRDNMKVVFFGRTSNGKSTTINAMLHSKVLPQGMGHTTCCFLQVQGCSEDSGYLMMGDDDTRIDISRLGEIGHAMSQENAGLEEMGQDSLLRVFHPKGSGDHENRLLQNDVVIVDSPGVDVSAEFDSWIDKHCLDADVFVLVSNAEATLTQSEKSFFHRVATKLSKPNVFILNNRWDASASECDSVEDVRQQHLNRLRQFLVNELEVCSDKDVIDRVFFISAKEVLESRLKMRGLFQKAYQVDGHKERQLEFQNFERHFEQCISRSAIMSKLEAHKRRADELISRMRRNMEMVQGSMARHKSALEQTLGDDSSEFNECRMNFAKFEQAYKEQTEHLRAEVNLKVSADFFEEIHRLEAIVDRFNAPFIDSSAGIAEYKKALAEYTDTCISNDLEARCTGGLMSRIWNLENDMYRYVTRILAKNYQPRLEEVWKYRSPFKFSISVDAPALITDFHEDLEFRFTFGLSAIIRRIIAYRSGQQVTSIQTNLLTPMALVIAIVAACYGGLYAMERLRWNSSAKEQHLKEQFRSHLAARMKQVAAVHTTVCETQVMREMDQVFDGLRATVGGVHREMKEDLDREKAKIEEVEGSMKALATIKGNTTLLLHNLEQFASTFLR